jgi:glutaredoxin 3
MSAQILMYTKVPCPFCDRAKTFFKNRGLAFEEIDLTSDPQKLEEIKAQTGWRTVPIILINNKLIGGYTDLKALDESGNLEGLLS